MPDIHSSAFSPRFFSRLFPARSIAAKRRDRYRGKTIERTDRLRSLGEGEEDTSDARLDDLELERERGREGGL